MVEGKFSVWGSCASGGVVCCIVCWGWLIGGSVPCVGICHCVVYGRVGIALECIYGVVYW